MCDVFTIATIFITVHRFCLLCFSIQLYAHLLTNLYITVKMLLHNVSHYSYRVGVTRVTYTLAATLFSVAFSMLPKKTVYNGYRSVCRSYRQFFHMPSSSIRKIFPMFLWAVQSNEMC